MTPSDLSAAKWFKSTRSNGSGQCVEVAFIGDGRVALRDSKAKDGPALLFSTSEWSDFIEGVRNDRLTETKRINRV